MSSIVTVQPKGRSLSHRPMAKVYTVGKKGEIVSAMCKIIYGEQNKLKKRRM